MADAATKGQGSERPDPDYFDPALAAFVPLEDGGGEVYLDGLPEAAGINTAEMAFTADLSPLLSTQALGKTGTQVCELTEQDERSRQEWRESYARGLALMGLNYEQRTDPWEGACGAFHPMLLESVIRFNAQAMTDLFPGAGPVKTEIVGRITDEKERQAKRIQTDMNWQASEKITGYRSETDMMLFNLPLAGTTFRKLYFDPLRKFPAAEYVLPEHVVMPYTAAGLDSTPRFAIILPKTTNWIEAKQAQGFYRADVKVGEGVTVTTPIKEAKDKIEGKQNSNTYKDALHRLYESHIDWFFAEDPLVTDSQPHPYIITVDSVSHKVLSIRRNWREGDPAMERQISLVQHKYMPGFGPYGIGLINILGGLTESATSILRQLIDAGTLSNLPAGFKTKSARIKDDSTPIGPGEWRDVDVGMGDLDKAFHALPYKEPSSVLAALLGQVVDEGRRIGSVADMKITDMTGQNMPVGTTLAIIERSMKVMSAVQQRLYESFKNEFRVLAEIIGDFMGEIPYPFELDQRDQAVTRAQDYDGKRVAVIPVADPNATTKAERIMTVQAVQQLSTSAPNIYDLKALHRDMITVLGSDKADLYIPPDEEVQPADPVSENMALLTSRPVRAGITQDHAAHITVHMAAAQDPKITAMLTNNPAAPSIIAATTAHILEHLAFQYRLDIEEQLGVPLPPPGEPLPEDVEYQISQLAAAAADKLLQKNVAEQKNQEIMQQLQDPVIQNETKALEIKAKEAETAQIKAMKDLELREIEIKVNAELKKSAQADELRFRREELQTKRDQINAQGLAKLAEIDAGVRADKAQAAAELERIRAHAATEQKTAEHKAQVNAQVALIEQAGRDREARHAAELADAKAASDEALRKIDAGIKLLDLRMKEIDLQAKQRAAETSAAPAKDATSEKIMEGLALLGDQNQRLAEIIAAPKETVISRDEQGRAAKSTTTIRKG